MRNQNIILQVFHSNGSLKFVKANTVNVHKAGRLARLHRIASIVVACLAGRIHLWFKQHSVN